MEKKPRQRAGGTVVPNDNDIATASSGGQGANRLLAPRVGDLAWAVPLDPEDLEFDAYIETGSKAAVARRLKISAAKVAAHLELPLVRQELDRRMEELLELLRARLHLLGQRAFETLKQLSVVQPRRSNSRRPPT